MSTETDAATGDGPHARVLNISAEYLLPRCGLAHYLETLVGALQQMQPESEILVKALEPLWEGDPSPGPEGAVISVPHLVSPGVREFIMTHIQPHLPRAAWNAILGGLSIYNYYGIHRSIAKWWAVKAPETCVLLPHIPLDPAVKRYYRALMRCRLIWVIHDLHPFFFPDAWNESSLKMCRTLLPELAKNARHIIVHNNFTRDSAVKYLGADTRKMTVIRLPNIMDLAAAGDRLSHAAVLNGLGVRQPYALWASSTTILHKNHERLIRAWIQVQARSDRRIQLVCTGSRQPRWHELSALLQSARVHADILFTDTVPKLSLQALLHNAALAVCPTLFEGGGCGPAMEAAYAGIPVVCSDIPQIREQYDQREDLCRFFDPLDENSIADAVLLALGREAETRSMADRARQWIQQRRTWADVAREYWSIINAVQKGEGAPLAVS